MSNLDRIATHATNVKTETAARDKAIADARAAGETWRAIAAAADMTELGCRKIVERVEAKGRD